MGNAFVALFKRGEVVRVDLELDLNVEFLGRAELVASDFMNPLDLDVGPDCSLYLIDFTPSSLYRVTYSNEVASEAGFSQVYQYEWNLVGEAHFGSHLLSLRSGWGADG